LTNPENVQSEAWVRPVRQEAIKASGYTLDADWAGRIRMLELDEEILDPRPFGQVENGRTERSRARSPLGAPPIGAW
jgi:hypothetical protein